MWKDCRNTQGVKEVIYGFRSLLLARILISWVGLFVGRVRMYA